MKLLAWLVMLTASVAHADPKADAQVHIDNASQLYKDNKFTESLAELNTAYTLDPQPELLFAIGQIHVKLGHCDDAITFYERFLATRPDPDAASATREAITACKSGKVPETTTPPPTNPTNPPPTVPTNPPPTNPPQPHDTGAGPATTTWYSDKLADALVLGGVTAGVIGIVLYASASGKLDDADKATTYPQQQSLVDDAHGARNLSIAFDVAAVGLIGYGVYHYLHFQEGASVVVTPAPGGGAVSWTGHF